MVRHYLHPRCGFCRMSFSSRSEYERHIATITHLTARTNYIETHKETKPSDEQSQDEEGIDLDLANFTTLDSVGEDDEDEEDGEGTEQHKENGGEGEGKDKTNGAEGKDVEDEYEEVDDDMETEVNKEQEQQGAEEEEDGQQQPLGMEYVHPVEAYYCGLCYKVIKTTEALGSRAIQRHCRSFAHISHYKKTHQDEEDGEDAEGVLDLEEEQDQDKLWEEVDKGLTALQGEILTEIEGDEEATPGDKGGEKETDENKEEEKEEVEQEQEEEEQEKKEEEEEEEEEETAAAPEATATEDKEENDNENARFRAAIVGHTQIPRDNIEVADGIVVDIYRVSGAKASDFFEDKRLTGIFEKTYDLVIVWLGSNDVNEKSEVKDIVNDISKVVSEIENRCKTEVVTCMIEPRRSEATGSSTVKEEDYVKTVRAVNRNMKGRVMKGKRFINFGAKPFWGELDKDEDDFEYEGKELVVAKLRNCINSACEEKEKKKATENTSSSDKKD